MPGIFQHGGKASEKRPTSPTSPTHVEWQKSQKALSVFGFGAPLVPPKITEGGPFDCDWPISRINTAVGTSETTSDLMSLEVRGAPAGGPCGL